MSVNMLYILYATQFVYYNYGEYRVSEHVCGTGRLMGFEEGYVVNGGGEC